MKKRNSKYGFTMIEVSLVLAIGGLIFLMVFVALPALQRQARDAQRREDMSTLITAIKNYQRNNRGALPSGDWESALELYLDNGFEDPDGTAYDIKVFDCDGEGNAGACKGNEELEKADKYTVIINRGADCDGEISVKSANGRKVAVQYKLEIGTYCGKS